MPGMEWMERSSLTEEDLLQGRREGNKCEDDGAIGQGEPIPLSIETECPKTSFEGNHRRSRRGHCLWGINTIKNSKSAGALLTLATSSFLSFDKFPPTSPDPTMEEDKQEMVSSTSRSHNRSLAKTLH